MQNMRISSAEFIKNYGSHADRALTEAVTITRNGRDRLVLLSAEEYDRLKQRDRQVVRLEAFSEADIAAMTAARVPAEHAHLDDELKAWRP